MIWEAALITRWGVQKALLIEAVDYEREVRRGLRLWEGSNTVSWGRNWEKGKGAVQGIAT